MILRFRSIIVFLLLGAIVNVAVAWGAWLWRGSMPVEFVEKDDALARWQDWAPADWKQRKELWIRMRHAIMTWEAAFREPADPESEATDGMTVYSQGWPLRSMQGCEYGWPEGHSRRFGVQLGANDGRWHPFIPLKPMWSGFAINTALYAAVLWMAFVAPFALRGMRGRRRIRRGLCPKCAYDLRGTRGGATTACPECGAAVARGSLTETI